MVIAMHEMLGHQYFLARRYDQAAWHLEKALQTHPGDRLIRRKLVVCYVQLGRIQRALEFLLSLIKEDIDFVLNTDPVADDCPCSQMVYELEQKISLKEASVNELLALGILWLYCDIHRSRDYFQRALARETPRKEIVESILTILKTRLNRKLNQRRPNSMEKVWKQNT